MPFDFRNDTARFLPRVRLVTEAVVATERLDRRTPSRPCQQVRYLIRENRVCLEPNCVEEILFLKIAVELWILKCRVTTKVALRSSPSMPFDDRLKDTSPVVSTMHIALPQKGVLYISMLVEAEQRVIAIAAKVTIVC